MPDEENEQDAVGKPTGSAPASASKGETDTDTPMEGLEVRRGASDRRCCRDD